MRLRTGGQPARPVLLFPLASTSQPLHALCRLHRQLLVFWRPPTSMWLWKSSAQPGAAFLPSPGRALVRFSQSSLASLGPGTLGGQYAHWATIPCRK